MEYVYAFKECLERKKRPLNDQNASRAILKGVDVGPGILFSDFDTPKCQSPPLIETQYTA